MKRTLLTLTLFFLLFPHTVFASRKLEIAADKATLAPDESLIISLNFNGFESGETVYIKGAFFREGSTNYFGLSQKGDSWIKNSATAVSQPSILVDSSPQILGVKNDPADTGFHGEGEYKIKVGYYYLTSGGNLSSINWSDNSLPIHMIAPAPPTTPSPTLSLTPTPSPIQEVTPNQQVQLVDSQVSEETTSEDEGEEITRESTPAILGKETDSVESPSPVVRVKSAVDTKHSLGPFFLGIGMLSLCAILICRKIWNLKFPFEQ